MSSPRWWLPLMQRAWKVPAMTTERGPGVPDELRERCIRALGGPAPILDWGILVDVILAEIDAAGYRIVPADRLERLIAVAENVLTWNQRGYLSPEQLGLQSGDLDPNESPR